MDKNERSFHLPFHLPPARIDLSKIGFNLKNKIYQVITFGTLLLIWHLAAMYYNNQLVMPTPWQTGKALLFALHDGETLKNLAITLNRVMIGLGIDMVIGLPIGFAMGYSTTVYKLVDPVIGPPATGTHYGLGSIDHCLVRTGRWSDPFSHRHGCHLSHPAQYHGRSQGCAAELLPCCPFHGRRAAKHFLPDNPARCTLGNYHRTTPRSQCRMDERYLSGVYRHECRVRFLYD